MLHNAIYPLTMYEDSTLHSGICFPYDLAAGVNCPVLTGWMCLFWKSSRSNNLSMLCLCSLAVNDFIVQTLILDIFANMFSYSVRSSFSWQPQCKSLRVSKSLEFSTLLFVLSLSFLRTNASHRVMRPHSSAFPKDYRFSDSISRLFWGLWVPCHLSIQY